MEDNLILEGLLSMVTELKEKLEAQVTPASREETLERLGTIEQALSELHSNSACLLYTSYGRFCFHCVKGADTRQTEADNRLYA